MVDGQKLLLLFGLMMIAVGASTLRTPRRADRHDVRLSRETPPELVSRLVGAGFGVGALSGFFGIGGGVLIVPGLMAATAMPMIMAVGTSLVSVAAFGATTAANYALSGLIDWRIAVLFIVAGIAGGTGGVALAHRLAKQKSALRLVFATVVVAVGVYVTIRGSLALV